MIQLVRYLSFRSARLKPARNLLTTLGVAFGIALYSAISIINESTRHSFQENVEAIAGRADLTVTAGTAGFAEEKIEIVRSTPGVQAAVALVESRAYFSRGIDSRESLEILGVDLLQEQSVRTYQTTDSQVIDDPLIFLNQPDSIIVTEIFARAHELKIDSKFNLQTAHGPRTFTVRGILKPEGTARAYGGALAIMDIDGARFMFKREGKVDRIDVVAKGVSVADLRLKLSERLGGGFVVEEPETTGNELRKMIGSYQKMLTFFSSLALLVGLFLIYNSTSVAVAERRREIGILRALGGTRKQVLTVFMVEAGLIGGVGALLGLGLGRLMASYLVDLVTESISLQYSIPVKVTVLIFGPQQMISTLAIGVIAALASAALPAYRASRISPIEALRPKGISFRQEQRGSYFTFVFGLLSLVASIVSMVVEFPAYLRPFVSMVQSTSVLGAACLGPFLVFGCLRLIRRVSRGRVGPITQIAQENILRSRQRVSSNLMALMVGLFFVMLISTVRMSFRHSVMGWLEDALVTDFLVTPAGRLVTADVQPVDENIQDELIQVPGVRTPKKGEGLRSRILKFTSAGKKYTIRAFDRPPEHLDFQLFAVTDRNRREAGLELFGSEEPLVMVSENYFTRAPHLKNAQTIELDTPSGRIPFRVIARVVDFAAPDGVFYLNRAVYKRYWKDSTVTNFGFNIAEGYTLEQVRGSVDRAIGTKYGLTTISNAEIRSIMRSSLDRSFVYTHAIEFAALLVALLGLLNTLLISVMERTREIGVLRAMGATRKQVSQMILLESLFQGVFGAIAAMGLGVLVGYFFVSHSLATSLGWRLQFHVPASTFLFTFACGVGVSALAGLYPAYRASRLRVVEALAHD